MRQVPEAESAELMASKKCLHMLEETELLNPDDLEILERIRALRRKVTMMEEETAKVRAA